ncbi:Na+/H+ antiporter subunit D, partial [Streptomyces pilosus]
DPAARPSGTRFMFAAAAGMTVAGIAIAVCAGPLAELGERAAEDLLHPRDYRSAVLGEGDR